MSAAAKLQPFESMYREVAALPDGKHGEILSRATQRGDRVVKLPTYAAFGVSQVWIVDVEVETVEVFACSSGKPVLVACVRGQESARLAPFDIEVCPAEFVALAL